MSKAAIDQMARTAATELSSKRIRVNMMHPGWIDTPGERKFFSEEELKTMGEGLPWGRMGRPEEFARGVVFMCDPASDYMTGSSILIDGGIGLPVQEMHRLDTPEPEATVGILLPIILYTGATGMINILDVSSMLRGLPETLGMDPYSVALWMIVWLVGIIGSIYALFGGLRTVDVSDTLNRIGLFVGGFLIATFALSQLGGDGGIAEGTRVLMDDQRDRFNSVGGPKSSVPFGTIFSGIFLLSLFNWTTNQQYPVLLRQFSRWTTEGQVGQAIPSSRWILSGNAALS